MVEIREEPSDSNDSNRPSTSGAGTSQSASSGTSQGVMSLSEFVTGNLPDSVLASTRVLTVFFSLCYLLPFISPVAPESAYYKAFAAGAATNALRLQQRIGTVQFTREFLGRVMLEDCCHYLFFCILFITSAPMTMALLPISFYAALHATSFFIRLLNATGRSSSPLKFKLEQFSQAQTQNCLGIIACAEIFIIPLLISMIFVGKASVFVPFAYYRFLTLRYASRRNPYTRQAFYQMRVSLDQVSASTRCPAPVRMLIQRSVGFISNLAPAI